MAISVKTNQLTGPAVTGNSATTDPGFQPKAIMVWNGIQTATGAVADAQFSLGVASSTSTETAAGWNSDDNVATSDTVRAFNTARTTINFTSGTTTSNLVADLNAFGASGFTLNWATLATASPLYNYLAIGGADITNVLSGSFAANTTTGNQSVTGIGFRPDVVIFFVTLQTSSAQANSNTCYSFGAATSSTAQWAASVASQNAVATMNTRRSFHDDACIYHPQAGSNATEAQADFVAMTSDGFTINWSDAPGQADLVGYLAMKGGQWKVGTDTQKTSTGTKSTTGVGFTPKGAIFVSSCDNNTNGITDNARMTVGASTGTSNNVSQWVGDADNTADAVANTIMSNNKCMIMATEGTSATPTTQAEAALSSFDTDGFTLDWTTADATARAFGYIAFGDSPAGLTTYTYTVSASNDDAHEATSDGSMNLTYDGNQTYATSTQGAITGLFHVGYRFPNVANISQGDTIKKAIFKTRLRDYSGIGALNNITLYGQATDSAAAFSTTTNDISSRTTTTANVPGLQLSATQSKFETVGVDVTPIIQEIVNRGGWVAGNNISLLFMGTGIAGSQFVKSYFWDYFTGTQPTTLEITKIVPPGAGGTSKNVLLLGIG